MNTIQAMNTVMINGTEMAVREWQGQRVVTFADIDRVHQRPEGTARKRFNDNKKHFILGVDYFVRKTDEAKKEFGVIAPNGLILLTEQGYLMVVKSLKDDLAWKVQRELVNSYFKLKGYDRDLTTNDILYILSSKQQETEKRLDSLEEKINVIGAYENSFRYGELKRAISSRVMSLLSDPILKCLWSPYFYRAIHNCLAKHFDVANSKLIPTNSIEEAKRIAYSWEPSDLYIQEKTIEMIKNRDAGCLSEKRTMALNWWNVATDNGKKNLFAGNRRCPG